MLSKEGVYASCKARVGAIQDAYDQLVAAVEAYRDHLKALSATADPNDDSDKQFLTVANLQRATDEGLLATLDSEVHDDLVRLSDRVIRFKHWEDGVFL